MLAALDSGRGSNDLRERLSGLAASVQTRLRADAGAALEEWISLSRESDNELFYQSLLALAHRLEERASPEVVGRIYHFLIHSPESPSGVAARARTRFQVLAGQGPFLSQLEHGLSRVVSASTSAEFLLGMTAGGLAFRVGRLWALQRLLGAGLRGGGLNLLASTAGLTTEAGAFLLTSRAIRTWNGPVGPWTVENVGREYASTWFLLGGLRLAGWGMGHAHRGVQSTWRGSWPARIPAEVFRQAGMAGGLLGVHSAAMGLGLEERRSLPSLLAQVGGEWVTFNVGARVAHRLLGPQVAGLERYLDAQGNALVATSRRGGPPLEALLHPQTFLGIPRPVFATGSPVPDHIVFSTRYNGGRRATAAAESYFPPRHGDSGPAARPRPSSPPPASEPRDTETAHRIWVGSQVELIEWIRGNRGNFHRRVREDHIFFRMVGREHYDSESVLAELNRLPFLSEIHRGRRIQIGFDDGAPSVEFIRLANRFFEWRRSGAEEISSEAEAPRVGSEELRDIRARMDRLSSPRLPALNPAAESASRPGAARSPSRAAEASREFGLVRGSQGLLDSLNRILHPDRGPDHLEILGYFHRGLQAHEIGVLRNRLSALPVGRMFTFHDGRANLSYRFERAHQDVGPHIKVIRWEMPENREEISSGNTGELMMGVLRLRNYYPPEPQLLRVLHSGRWSSASDGAKFLELLNLEGGLLFREIQVELVSPRSVGEFTWAQRFVRGETGEWRMD